MAAMDVAHEQAAGSQALGGATTNVPEFTVSQVSQAVQRTIEGAFGRVRIRGEISGFKRAPSGHLYFSLKDADAVLAACCWKGAAQRLGIRPEDGMEVVAIGKLTTFPGQSKYQIIVETIELAGKGALLALIEERKRRLGAEGLFDPARKRPLPYLPGVIGIVTSPTGAVIRDMLHRLDDRFPRHVLVWPVLVQGEAAAGQVAAAIEGFNRILPGGPVPRPDVLIVARGGGSIEDLMAFNEELVVRAAAASAIPLISAVGHETDTTLIDFASDRRAPTPTAAAEMAVPVRSELRGRIREQGDRLAAGLERGLEQRQLRLDGLKRGLGDPHGLLAQARQRLDDRAERLENCARAGIANRRQLVATLAARLPHPRTSLAMAGARLEPLGAGLARAVRAGVETRRAALVSESRALDRLGADQRRQLADLAERLVRAGEAMARAVSRRQDERRERLSGLDRLLESFDHHKVLARGFALVRDNAGHVVLDAAAVKPVQPLTIEFRDGKVGAVASGAPKPRRKPDGTIDQGSLL